MGRFNRAFLAAAVLCLAGAGVLVAAEMDPLDLASPPFLPAPHSVESQYL